MSNLYNLEPTPTAKVLLQTTSGDIILELFAKQIPLASRNFLQLCLDGYYDNTIFHRVIPNFILQGGDPTGTGFGGQSAIGSDGEPFADEFHSRLKYNRRGLLGMANSGKKDDNGSQFFITLGVTPELAGKNTLFGRVVGDTIFNVVKMGEAEMATEGGERPLYPDKITGTEILVNPFEDMVRRERVIGTEKKAEKKKVKRKIGKALLSFGGDEEEDGPSLPVIKKTKFNPKLVSGPEIPTAGASKAASSKTATKTKPVAEKPKAPIPIPTPVVKHEEAPRRKRSPSPESDSYSSSSPQPVSTSRKEQLNKAQAEIDALKASLRRPGAVIEKMEEKPKSALEAMIPSTSKRGRKRGAAQTSSSKEEARTLALFNAFRNKLDTVEDPGEKSKSGAEAEDRNGKGKDTTMDDDDDEEAALCDLHFIANCQSCSNWEEDNGYDDDDVGEGWMSHQLSFEKDRLGKDLEWRRKNKDELVVIDPREKARELGIEKGSKKDRPRRDWDKKEWKAVASK